MKSKNKPKKYEVIWTCDFCGKEFKTKKESDRHELTCKNNKNREILLRIKIPNKKNFFILVFSFLGMYLLTFAFINSYAETNGLSKRYLINPKKWFSEESNNEITPILTPTTILELTPTPTPKPKNQTNNTNQNDQIECIGPDGKHFNTSMTECKNLAEKWGKKVDYMTNCTYPEECGGGVHRISKSECDTPCEIIKTNKNTSNTSNYVMVSLYGGDMIVWCKPEVVQTLNDLYPQVQSSSKLWADTCVVTSPPSQCDLLKQDANRKEDNYKSIFMNNCVNKK